MTLHDLQGWVIKGYAAPALSAEHQCLEPHVVVPETIQKGDILWGSPDHMRRLHTAVLADHPS